ncbi:sulfurtransferase-like selenium metabolism protein YedF [Vagococcus zengguangii]|uniref:Sulfurtransferase-like selenium metabolism protein YedF n=1 Tax=Vagococcus zengguangii TaxID=2571750 RepID=A0A4D7CVZ9_9ENTE|nr:sulfurtransferase-like selenium metabolism protein YedF [Vagococcus zengguangii]QCI86441.1 sulfurtransferase-like selenium metabolism protein YedF [Vagococcus zengguangii]
MKKIDARGLSCPLPVIQTKKALEAHEHVLTIVDNYVAVQNLEKMASQLGYKIEVNENTDGFYVNLAKSAGNFSTELQQDTHSEPIHRDEDYIVVIDSDEMGKGNPTLGQNLIKTFVNTLLAQDSLPSCVLLYNSGVKLVTEVEQTINDFKELEDNGVEVLTCGACLEFYELTEQLSVGNITNMYHIVHTIRTHTRVIKP